MIRTGDILDVNQAISVGVNPGCQINSHALGAPIVVGNRILTCSTDEGVSATTPEQIIVTITTIEDVIPIQSVEGVIAPIAHQRIIAVGSG